MFIRHSHPAQYLAHCCTPIYLHTSPVSSTIARLLGQIQLIFCLVDLEWSFEVLFGDGAEEVMSTEEFESIERALMQLTGPLLRVAMDMQTQRGAAFFGVKLRRTNSGRLRPRPVRVKVRIDERQIGIRRYLRLRVPSRGENE